MIILRCSKFSYSCSPRFIYIFVVLSPGFDFIFSVLVKRFAGKSISEMTYIVSSGMSNLNSCSQSIVDDEDEDNVVVVVVMTIFFHLLKCIRAD